MFSNDFAAEKKSKEENKPIKSKEDKSGFNINDDDLLNTFG